ATLYLEGGELTNDIIQAAIRRQTLALKMVAVFCGSAYKNKGVQKLLDGVAAYLPNPKERVNKAFNLDESEAEVELQADPEKPFVGLAFKLEDGRYGQLTYLRIYQGTLKKGDFVINAKDEKRVKVGRIVRMHADD